MCEVDEHPAAEAGILVPAEVAYKGTKRSRHWFFTKNNPEQPLEEFYDFAR